MIAFQYRDSQGPYRPGDGLRDAGVRVDGRADGRGQSLAGFRLPVVVSRHGIADDHNRRRALCDRRQHDRIAGAAVDFAAQPGTLGVPG
jgi:hypothetical protein